MKITYLIGAGASANTLPIVSNMVERLINFRDYIHKIYKASSKQPGDAGQQERSDRANSSVLLTRELDELINALVDTKTDKLIPKIASVDTYAKQLLIRGDSDSKEKMRQLKRILILFFAFEQKVRGNDLRYDSFFASIIKDDQKQLPDMKIISWNYDLQFELAFSKYLVERSNDDILLEIQNHLGVVTKRILPNKLPWPNQSNPGFSIYKLNGSTSYYNSEGKILIPLDYYSGTDHQVDSIMDYYIMDTKPSSHPIYPSLSFAWEKESHEKGIDEIVSNASKETEILVIIGYSFPFFNRAVDQRILSNMKPAKIYIQDRNPDKIVTRIKSTYNFRHRLEFITIDDIDQFALPDELTI